MDCHFRPETSGLYGHALIGQIYAKPFIEMFRVLRRSRTGEPGSIAPRSIRRERELTNDKSAT